MPCAGSVRAAWRPFCAHMPPAGRAESSIRRHRSSRRTQRHGDFALLQAEIVRELDIFDALERSVRQLDEEIATLSEQTGMASLLESIPGVADVTASVFLGYIGQVQRFKNVSSFKTYCGAIPRVVQSGVQRNTPLTKAGPDHVKQVLFMAANSARQCDPQLAKICWIR